jgi:hypothetical protein
MLENWPQADIPVRTIRDLRAHDAMIPAGTLGRLVRALGRMRALSSQRTSLRSLSGPRSWPAGLGI